MRKSEYNFEADVDALFRLPLAEFTGARNTLAARLKKSGRAEGKAEANRVKELAKPSMSAWAVNQLYWNHRQAFDQLLASGERFHKAQTSGKVADMREALDARREGLAQLSETAASVMRDAGHNPSLDTVRRVTTTLEAISAMSVVSARAARSDAPRPGRLTHDVDPPGFESFGSFVPTATKQKADGKSQAAATSRSDIPKPALPTPATRLAKFDGGAAGAQRKRAADDASRRVEEKRKTKIAAAKVVLQDAKRALAAARVKSQSLEAAQKMADAKVKETERRRSDAEERLRKAKTASEDAVQSARSVEADAKEVARSMKDAERTVEEATRELESLSQ